MRQYYYAAFMPASEGGYDIVIPDIPNAFTCADTMEEGFAMAEEVVAAMLSELVLDKKPVPNPSPLEQVKGKTADHLLDIDHQPAGEIIYQLIPAPNLDASPVKVTISLPKAVLEEIDAHARRTGFTRSGYLAAAARAFHARQPDFPN